MLRMSPLQWAAARGHGAAAAALVRRGADLSLVDKFGHTARALAARRGHQHVVRALDDAARAREAQRSVRALQADQMPESPTTDAQMRSFETVQKLSDETTLKQNKLQQERSTTIKTEPVTESSEEAPAGGAGGAGGAGAGGAEGAAAQLLRKHGITLLPADDGSTVLNALQSGRTVVLSDAGKLMLKESDELATLSRVSAASVTGAASAASVTGAGGRAGLKVFTLNNKLLLPAHAHSPAKKLIHPNDLQVKFVQLPADNKLNSAGKTIPMKAKAKAASSGAARPAVKIIMNKANFNKLLANATTTRVSHAADAQATKSTNAMSMDSSSVSVGGAGGAGVADVCAVSAEALAALPAAALRALLTRALHELRDTRKALAQLREAQQR
ncbi:hypothetical protein O3G_MSEX008979 [Manduca sexta]|uniref:Uncharacterized protein n=2 Tax=Manduca sexta TaxID=7130 RepID=A0A921ZCC2_MANSE|nr:hypothetical protein O3G_MSEX008979 [Manduca sexta]KAG6454966.1 hypothetical protein O3G_MSEX008979 [Manduca sexta]